MNIAHIGSEEPTTALEDFPDPAFKITFAELDVTSEKMNATLSFEPLNEWLEKYADDLRLIPKRPRSPSINIKRTRNMLKVGRCAIDGGVEIIIDKEEP